MSKNFVRISLLIMFCLTFVVACGNKQKEKLDVSSQAEEKVITVAANGSFFPVIYTDDKGNLTGFEHDVMEEIGKRAGYTIKFEVVGDYSAMFEGLDSGKYDTIAGQVSVTEAREKKYNFSTVYGYNAIKLAVRGDDSAKSIEDMQGRKVCIEFGTVLEEALNKINEKFPEGKKIELVTTEGNIYEELKVGHYDAFPITVLSFDQVNKKGEYNFKLIGEPILIDKNAFPFAKNANQDMLKAVDKAIEEMQKDGTMSKLSEQYFARDISKEEITE